MRGDAGLPRLDLRSNGRGSKDARTLARLDPLVVGTKERRTAQHRDRISDPPCQPASPTSDDEALFLLGSISPPYGRHRWGGPMI